jgi:pimeloyl-ACP methyl ester carboxylesterase
LTSRSAKGVTGREIPSASPSSFRARTDREDADSWVRQRFEAALRWIASPALLCVVAKSISTRALLLPAAARLPGVWLTPLLTEPDLARAVAARVAPTLLVGGTADASWRGNAATLSSAEILEIPGADHALQINRDPSASLEALRQVVARLDAFLAAVETPMRPTGA